MISIQSGALAGPVATLDQPVEHLLACHRRIEQRLETLERVVPFLWERRDDALAAVHKFFAFMDSSGVLHTEDEERSVFPRLTGRLTAEQEALLKTLEEEHVEADRLFGELRSVVAEIEQQGTASEELRERYQQTAVDMCEHYRNHIHLEDTQLAPVCKRLLSAAEQAEIAAEMKARRGVKPAG